MKSYKMRYRRNPPNDKAGEVALKIAKKLQVGTETKIFVGENNIIIPSDPLKTWEHYFFPIGFLNKGSQGNMRKGNKVAVTKLIISGEIDMRTILKVHPNEVTNLRLIIAMDRQFKGSGTRPYEWTDLFEGWEIDVEEQMHKMLKADNSIRGRYQILKDVAWSYNPNANKTRKIFRWKWDFEKPIIQEFKDGNPDPFPVSNCFFCTYMYHSDNPPTSSVDRKLGYFDVRIFYKDI
jgi:hypothetical protein